MRIFVVVNMSNCKLKIMKRIFRNIFYIVAVVAITSSCGSLNKTTDNSVLVSKTDTQSGHSLTATNETNSSTKKEDKKKKNKAKKNDEDREKNKNTYIIELSQEALQGEWVVYSINGILTTGDERPYVIFDDSTMYANNGCNTINAQYHITNGKKGLSFSNQLSTQRYCNETEAPYEQGFNTALNSSHNIAFEERGNEYYLCFFSNTGATLMELRKANIDFFNGIWRITKINGDGGKCKNKNYTLAIDMIDKKVHGQLACNIVNGDILLDPNKQNSIMFLDLITTRMSCPDLAIESEILIALEKVEKYSKEKNKRLLLKDKDGNVVLEVVNISDKYNIN